MNTYRGIRRLTALVGLIALVVPLNASADVTKTGSFDRADVDQSCNFKMAFGLPEVPRNSPGSACDIDATGDAATGAMAVDLSVATPGGGTLPGQTYGYAIPSVSWSVPVESRNSITVTVVVHVDSATATATTPFDDAFDLTNQPAVASFGRELTMVSSAIVTSNASLSTCVDANGCEMVSQSTGGGSTIVDSAYGPLSRSGVDLVQTWTILNASGANLPAGTLSIRAGIDSLAGGGAFQPTIGLASVSVRASVTSITIS